MGEPKQAVAGVEFPRSVTFVECVDCGESISYLKPGEPCDDCREQARRYAAGPENNRAGVLAASGVPRRYTATPFESRPERPWPRDSERGLSLEDWTGDPWCAYLAGECGTGKTMFSVELLFRWVCSKRRGFFIKAGKVPGLYFSREHHARVERLERVSLLVVDELGRGHLGNAWEAVAELLAVRYDEMLPTLITTNMPLDELAATDDHVADRIREGLVLQFSGRSWR